jgi:hypothetical protein
MCKRNDWAYAQSSRWTVTGQNHLTEEGTGAVSIAEVSERRRVQLWTRRPGSEGLPGDEDAVVHRSCSIRDS